MRIEVPILSTARFGPDRRADARSSKYLVKERNCTHIGDVIPGLTDRHVAITARIGGTLSPRCPWACVAQLTARSLAPTVRRRLGPNLLANLLQPYDNHVSLN